LGFWSPVLDGHQRPIGMHSAADLGPDRGRWPGPRADEGGPTGPPRLL